MSTAACSTYAVPELDLSCPLCLRVAVVERIAGTLIADGGEAEDVALPLADDERALIAMRVKRARKVVVRP